MGDRGRQLAHRRDAVGVRELRLNLAILPLAAGALQGNGGLRGEVPEQGNLFVGERLHLFAAQSNYPHYLIVLEQRHNQARSKTCVHHRDRIIIPMIAFKCCQVGDVGG
jgi:hypothetical protein